MSPKKIAQYDSPHQFEPLLPGEAALRPLLETSSDLTRAATALQNSTRAQREMKALLRVMNSYYSNKLEGEHTRPIELERALQQEYSANADVARRQRLAVAHVRTEERCEAALDELRQTDGDVLRAMYVPNRLTWLHRELFESLPEQDRELADRSRFVAGSLRTRQVAVGRHEPPVAASLNAFLDRWADVYGNVRRGEMSILAAVASHHRLTWIHPFLDGNGRVARLHTHLLFHAMGLMNGMWSPLRGFARSEQKYKSLLQAADEHRRGDLDGRGNLTERGLVEWMRYVLDMCLDQVRFMEGQLDIAGMYSRMESALIQDSRRPDSGIRTEALRPLHYLFATDAELARGEFKVMTGLGDRLATDLVSSLLRNGYLASESAYGKLRFAIPRHALRHYFPNLWPEAEADPEMLEAAPALDRSATQGALAERPHTGYYVLRKSGSGYVFTLRSIGNDVLLMSALYATRQAALDGIAAVQENSPLEDRYSSVKTASGFVFTLHAADKVVLCTSETYASSASLHGAIKASRRDGPSRSVIDIS